MTQNNLPILVVEDEPLLLEAITKKLAVEKFEPHGYQTAADALAYLQATPILPKAIWLDYYLKDSSGVEFMQQLQANSNWQDIPVLVVSNSANDENVQRMLNMGVKKYLLKAEYRLEDIIKELQTIIPRL